MNEIVKVDEETMTVSAKQLHSSLNIATPLNKWFSRMCEYGFVEGEDFWTKMSESTGGRPGTDYEMQVDMAKQICMIQRTPEGRRVRQYLIDLEKAWNTPEQILARALKIADKTIEDQKYRISHLSEENEKLKERNAILTFVNKTYTATEIAKELGMKSASELNKRLYKDGIQYKSNGTWVMYSEYSGRGFEEIKQEVLDNGKVIYNRHFTQLGRDFILNKYKEER